MAKPEFGNENVAGVGSQFFITHNKIKYYGTNDTKDNTIWNSADGSIFKWDGKKWNQIKKGTNILNFLPKTNLSMKTGTLPIETTPGTIYDIPSETQGKTTTKTTGIKSEKQKVPLSELPDEYKQLRMAMIQGRNPNANVNLPQATDLGGSFLGSLLKGAGEGSLNVLGDKLSQETGKYRFDKEIAPQLEQTYGKRFIDYTPEKTQLEQEQLEGMPDYLGLRQQRLEKIAQQETNPQFQYSSQGLTPGQQGQLDYATAMAELNREATKKGIWDNVAAQEYLSRLKSNNQISSATANSMDALLSAFSQPQQPVTTK